jgi:hypothetical protein
MNQNINHIIAGAYPSSNLYKNSWNYARMDFLYAGCFSWQKKASTFIWFNRFKIEILQ